MPIFFSPSRTFAASGDPNAHLRGHPMYREAPALPGFTQRSSSTGSPASPSKGSIAREARTKASKDRIARLRAERELKESTKKYSRSAMRRDEEEAQDEAKHARRTREAAMTDRPKPRPSLSERFSALEGFGPQAPSRSKPSIHFAGQPQQNAAPSAEDTKSRIESAFNQRMDLLRQSQQREQKQLEEGRARSKNLYQGFKDRMKKIEEEGTSRRFAAETEALRDQAARLAPWNRSVHEEQGIMSAFSPAFNPKTDPRRFYRPQAIPTVAFPEVRSPSSFVDSPRIPGPFESSAIEGIRAAGQFLDPVVLRDLVTGGSDFPIFP